MFDHIDINPEIMLGQPVIKQTRLPVYVIVEAIAESDTQEDILRAYPFLKPEDIHPALQYVNGTRSGFAD